MHVCVLRVCPYAMCLYSSLYFYQVFTCDPKSGHVYLS